MASIVRTFSPLLSLNNDSSLIELPPSGPLSENENSKRVASDFLATEVDFIDRPQYDIAHITDLDDTHASENRLEEPAAAHSRGSSDQPGLRASGSAFGPRKTPSIANIPHDGKGNTTSRKGYFQSSMQSSTTAHGSFLGSQAHDEMVPVSTPRLGNPEDVAGRPNTKLLRPTTVSIPRWRVTSTFDPTSMTSLGKGRFLARLLGVPSEAKARFAQIKDTLEADVKRLITGIPSANQILWSHRISMVGNRSGTTITAEPTILITCGSQKCRRKIKESLLRIRPHYLESLGMTLIVRYDKFAPVLAGLSEGLPKGDQEPLQREFGIIRIQWPPSITSCGLKIMIEFRSSGTLRRAFATLGGIVKVGGVWYGVTTAHAIVNNPSDFRDREVLDDSANTMECCDLFDSSDEDIRPESCQSQHRTSEADLLHVHQDLGFTRLVGGPSGEFVAYSFNGAHQSSLGSITMDTTVSDWAILEIPDTFIRPNIYVQSPEISKDGIERLAYLSSVTSQAEMVSGTVHILCDEKRPHTGYLNMNLVSLQLESGALDVHEVLLEKALASGVSGSWVVKENQLVGMVVAISDRGHSCYILPMWKVFESIQTICGQEVQFCDLSSLATVSGSRTTSARQHRTVQVLESVQTRPTNSEGPEKDRRIHPDRYDDLMSRLVSNQELIAKALLALTSPTPLLGRFLDPDERSEALTALSGPEPVFEPSFNILKPSDSFSQSSTLVATRKQGLNQNDFGLYAETILPTQELSEEDFLKHVTAPAWISQFPKVLRELLDWRSLQVHNVALLSLGQELESTNTILECYDIDVEGVPVRLHANSKSTKFASWSALAATSNAKSTSKIAGKMIISKDPTVLHLAVLHLILNKDFDMHSILHMLVDDSPSAANMKGYLEPHIVKQKSFIFSFKYHCIIGPESNPLPWQESDQSSTASEYGFSLSTCSAVICLSLSGSSKQSTRRKSHRDQATTVHIFEPFGSWKLLKIQCFPDQISSLEDYESDSKFMNGPEAFVIALLSEYRDAVSRYKDLHQKISGLVLPPTTLVFDSKLRDKLLFENSNYTLSRRYFWANQVLKLMDKEIEDMISAYGQSLTDKVWKGEHKYIWPGVAETSPKFHAWRQKMQSIRKEIDYEISQLQSVRSWNSRLQGDIDALRNQLFTGLAVDESRNAVDSSKAMKTLSILTLFYLPATFVSTVFGMNFYRSSNGKPWRSWLDENSMFLYWGSTLIVANLALVFMSLVNGSKLSRTWRVCKSWVIHTVRSISSRSSEQEATKPPGVPAKKNLNPRDKTSGSKQRKTLRENEALPEGLEVFWYHRRNISHLYASWVIGLLSIFGLVLCIIQLVTSSLQVYDVFKESNLGGSLFRQHTELDGLARQHGIDT